MAERHDGVSTEASPTPSLPSAATQSGLRLPTALQTVVAPGDPAGPATRFSPDEDENGEPMEEVLEISNPYTGPAPETVHESLEEKAETAALGEEKEEAAVTKKDY